MRAKKIVLTGTFGKIGSLAIRELLSQGYKVVAFDKEGPADAALAFVNALSCAESNRAEREGAIAGALPCLNNQ